MESWTFASHRSHMSRRVILAASIRGTLGEGNLVLANEIRSVVIDSSSLIHVVDVAVVGVLLQECRRLRCSLVCGHGRHRHVGGCRFAPSTDPLYDAIITKHIHGGACWPRLSNRITSNKPEGCLGRYGGWLYIRAVCAICTSRNVDRRDRDSDAISRDSLAM